MEPQQSHQPDPPDDDPDQDPDQPPPHPSPALLDTALSLVAQPLASAAARVAASHPLALPLDDLNDFNVDLSWAGADIDSLFLNDTQYLQLGDDHPQPTSTPVSPTPLRPAPSASATATVTQPIPDAHSDPPISSNATTPPPPRRSRPRPSQPPLKQMPIPIAPRTVNNKSNKPLLDLKHKPTPPTPRSTQAHSSPLDTVRPLRPQSAPPIHTSDCSPNSVSRDIGLTQNPPNSITHFPLALSHHPMIALMNMYPLQHNQAAFYPSPPVLSPADSNIQHSKILHPSNTPSPSATKNIRLSGTQSPPSASHHRSQQQPVAQQLVAQQPVAQQPVAQEPVAQEPVAQQPVAHQPVAQQPFLSPAMQVMPQGVLPYDASIMPFFQMAYPAAAAGYPQGIVPPIPSGSQNVPSPVLNPFGPTRAQGVHHENLQNVPTSATEPSTTIHPGQQPPSQNTKPPGGSVVVQGGGTQVFVPQQKAARLERHPVLGRLHLKTSSKPQVATSSGLQSGFGTETQTPAGDDQQKTYLSSTGGASKAGPPSIGSRDPGQRQQKKRLVWTPELHDRFVKAINSVGLSEAVPKTLVTIMNVDGLTTEHVKSHLQKYRNSLRKEAAEEERDRSRGARPSAGPHNPKLGTPGASGASVIHTASIVAPSGSAANRIGQQGSAVVTNAGGPQSLPILPNRISAFEGQIPRVIQPALQARVSTQGAKPFSTTPAALEGSQQRAHSRSPRSPSRRSPKGADAFQGTVSTGVVAPSQGRIATQNGRQSDAMHANTEKLATDKINAVAWRSASGNVVQDSRNVATAQGAPDKAIAASPPEEAPSTTKQGSTVGIGAQADAPPKGRADANAKKESGLDAVGKRVNENRTQTSKGSGCVGNVGSASQSNRDSELELMKEDTQQMQLQVQMMVYRTIALEKKLEEMHSERLNAEASGTADASKRSAVGDANSSGVQNLDVEMRDKGEGKKAVSADRTNETGQVGLARGVQGGSDKCCKENEIRGNKKRRHPSASDGQSEVKALLSEQMGLQKRLKDASAMIDKRMKRDGEEGIGNDERDEGRIVGDKGRGKCDNEKKGDRDHLDRHDES